jgi:hypothetical protein
MRKPLNARSTKFVKIQTSMRATLGANPVKSEWRLHHQAIPGGNAVECCLIVIPTAGQRPPTSVEW